MSISAMLAMALILDALMGEPEWLYRRIPHPVVMMSASLMAGESMLNRNGWSAARRRLAGIALIIVLVVLMLAIGTVVESVAAGFTWGFLIVVPVAAMLLAARSLFDHVNDVHLALAKAPQLAEARTAVGKIIGRKTDDLDEAAVSRATIESLAENFSDGVIAPAFWFLIAGLPGLLVYKMVNTADSMIGHRSERYEAFGWAAARLDDVLNLAPARLTAMLFALAAIIQGRGGQTISTAWRQARLHASPNAGWPEAAMAGALDIRLGGPRSYADNLVVDGAWFGSGGTASRPHIKDGLRIAMTSWLVVLIALAVGGLL